MTAPAAPKAAMTNTVMMNEPVVSLTKPMRGTEIAELIAAEMLISPKPVPVCSGLNNSGINAKTTGGIADPKRL